MCLCVSQEYSLLLVHPSSHVYTRIYPNAAWAEFKDWGPLRLFWHKYTHAHTGANTHKMQHLYSVVLNQQEGTYGHSHWGLNVLFTVVYRQTWAYTPMHRKIKTHAHTQTYTRTVVFVTFEDTEWSWSFRWGLPSQPLTLKSAMKGHCEDRPKQSSYNPKYPHKNKRML